MIVGVNRYGGARRAPIEILKIDQALEDKQVERVAQAARHGGTPRRPSALAPAQGRRGGRGPQPHAGDRRGLARYVTMGEMCDALREVWGTWRETPVF